MYNVVDTKSQNYNIKDNITLETLSMASLLWDIDKQYSPRCDAAERGVPFGAIVFAQRISSKNEIKIKTTPDAHKNENGLTQMI